MKNSRYAYGGLEYGGECWGADDLNPEIGRVDGSNCEMKCNDVRLSSFFFFSSFAHHPPNPLQNQEQTCGGNLHIDVYNFKIADKAKNNANWSCTPFFLPPFSPFLR